MLVAAFVNDWFFMLVIQPFLFFGCAMIFNKICFRSIGLFYIISIFSALLQNILNALLLK